MQSQTVCYDAELSRRLEVGGAVELVRPANHENLDYFVTGKSLSVLLKKHSAAGSGLSCTSLTMTQITIRGLLDLASHGSEAEPIARLYFRDCTFEGGLSCSQTCLGSLTILGGFLVPFASCDPPRLSAEKAVILQELRICDLKFKAPGSYVELSGALLKHGCLFEDIGSTTWPLERLSLKGATVAGDLTFRRLRVSGISGLRDRSALNLERLAVTGTLLLTGFNDLEGFGLFRLLHGLLQMMSWIVFPLAAITFTGVLREKPEA